MTRTPLIITGSLVALAAVAGIGFTLGANDVAPTAVSTPSQTVTAQPEVALPDSETSAPAVEADTSTEATELLAYLVEEEKLAHDVYVALGDIWGDRVFTNISNSESTHQDQVASLLVAYGIDDPRSSEPGVFVNDELQALYDALIEKGSQSRTDAMEVGVLIEETDITDLQVAIDTIDDATIDSTLERLLNASYNHLDAFTRQL